MLDEMLDAFAPALTSAKLIAKKKKKKKNEEIHDRNTECYIENIYHQFPDPIYLCNQISDEFKVQKQPPVVFFKYIFLKLRSITGKHLCSSLFLMKLQASSLATLLKRDSNRAVFL